MRRIRGQGVLVWWKKTRGRKSRATVPLTCRHPHSLAQSSYIMSLRSPAIGCQGGSEMFQEEVLVQAVHGRTNEEEDLLLFVSDQLWHVAGEGAGARGAAQQGDIRPAQGAHQAQGFRFAATHCPSQIHQVDRLRFDSLTDCLIY